MHISSIILYFTSLANISLGLLVLFRDHKRTRNIAFALLSLGVALWSLGISVFRDYSSHRIIFISGILVHSAAGMAIFALLLFSFTFPEGELPVSKVKKFLLRMFFPLALLLTVFPGAVVLNVKIGSTNTITYARGFIIFATLVLFCSFWSFVNLLKKFRAAKSQAKQQILYLFLGVAIGATIGIVTNLILPGLGVFNYNWIGPSATLIMVGFIAYAIIRHRLLDIRFVITRSLIYGILLTVVSLAFIFITIISAQFFGGSTTSRNAISVFAAALIIFGLDPFRNFLSRITDRIFFKAKVDYQALLRDISESLSFEINRDELIKKIRVALKDGMKVSYTVTLLRKTTGGTTEKFEALPDMMKANPNYNLQNNSPLVAFLREHRHPSLLESLERKIDDTPENKRGPLVASRSEFERMNGALAAPIYAQGHLIAILVLGPKLSGDTFSNDDLQMLEVLAPQIGSAIQKANLFEEVRQFGESLKAKVEAATAELQERNVSLETLQNITKDITRRLDFNQVVQNIADSVSTKLGYLGAILVFIDDDGKTVRARAITQTALTKRALDVLPTKFSDYTTDIHDPKSNSLGHKVLRTGEIITTDNFADVVSPPLPRLLAATIQKIIGIKSIVLIPIVAEGKTIGVIEIGTKKALKDIDQTEIATMQAMADELGIVARNIQLFEKLRVTNDQLGVANEHLKELDQAKSEFVSIASHQLRTPMTGIMGYLSMMTQGDFGKIKPEHQKILVDLLNESQRMIRLINQFLNVSKIEAGKFTYAKKPIQIENLIEAEVHGLAKVAGDKGLKLLWTKPAEPLPTTVADPDKLQDVILNLIDNAVKYTEKGSITVSAQQEDGNIHVLVKDSGVGIKAKDAPELFNKFVRGSGMAQIHPDGSGLGLFIAKSVIDAHGGRIWADSEGEGKGSTFQFTLPITAAPPPAKLAKSADSA